MTSQAKRQYQNDLALPLAFLIALENEEKHPILDILLRLVDVLNIPGDAILHPQLQAMDSEDEQLIRMMMRLNNRDKQVIRSTILSMLETYHEGC